MAVLPLKTVIGEQCWLPAAASDCIPQEAASISVGTDGTVSVELSNGGGNQQIGQIQVARFINASGLDP